MTNSGFSDPNAAISMVVWIIYTPLWILSVILSILRRKKYPLKQREPWLLIMSSVGGYFILTSYTWQTFVTEYPCPLSDWLIWGIIPLHFVPYPFRAARLLFIFNISFERSETGLLDEKTKLTKGPSFLLRNRFIFLNITYFVPAVLFVIFVIGLFRFFLVPSNLPPNTNCQDSTAFYLNSLIVLGIFVILLIIGIFFLRKVRDEYSINDELKMICVIWIVTLVPALSIGYVNVANGHILPLWTVYFFIVFVISSWTVSTCWALYRSFYPINLEWPDYDVLNDFDSLLAYPKGKDAFSKFLTKVDLSVENFLFYYDVEAFQKIPATEFDSKCERALEIYEKYLEPYAQFQVNIDMDQTRPIEAVIKEIDSRMKPSSNFEKESLQLSENPPKQLYHLENTPANFEKLHKIFDEAKHSCYLLMKNDSFIRFKKSNECAELISLINKEKIAKENLNTVHMLLPNQRGTGREEENLIDKEKSHNSE